VDVDHIHHGEQVWTVYVCAKCPKCKNDDYASYKILNIHAKSGEC